MRSRMAVVSAVTVVSGLMMPLLAQAANGFGGNVSAGYIATSGNSDTRSLNASATLNYTQDAWQNVFGATALGAAAEGSSTAERYTANDKLNYNFSDHDYAYGQLDWEKDLFGSVEQLTTQTVGYGRKILIGPVHTLDADIGIGVREQIINGTDEHEDDGILHVGGKYGWQLSKTSNFSQALSIDSGRTNTHLESITALKVNIVGNLFTTLSYTFRHNSVAADGLDKTDTVTAINLSYDFGLKH